MDRLKNAWYYVKGWFEETWRTIQLKFLLVKLWFKVKAIPWIKDVPRWIAYAFVAGAYHVISWTSGVAFWWLAKTNIWSYMLLCTMQNVLPEKKKEIE